MKDSTDLLPLRSERLVLRELEDEDFDAVHAYASDPVVVRFMPWGPNSEAHTTDFLRRAREYSTAQPRLEYELAVVLRHTGTLLGAMGLHREDLEAREAMLGYCFGREAWGHGYATEAGHAMIRFAFGDLGLGSIWAGCDAENIASIRVLEKLGLTRRSTQGDDTDGRGESQDSLMFRIRSNEWADRRQTG